MPHDYPVRVEVTSPVRFERIQLLVRVLFSMVLGWIGITGGFLACVLFGGLPLVAAIAISSSGGSAYQTGMGLRVWRGLSWLLQLSAYMLILVDRFPTGGEHPTRFEVQTTGTPKVSSALLRLLTSIPSAFVLSLIWIASSLLWVIAVLTVLFTRTVPDVILAFQRGVLRWQARLLAYHASLVEEYPPFSLDTDDEPVTTLPVARGQ